ncbi:MAG: hypothetical protein L6R40_005031 [Gallowayella cf. fulva]|nr:MAG: hypothetical protein L6R40_005031 [Xanthomendoza cf. fulva]
MATKPSNHNLNACPFAPYSFPQLLPPQHLLPLPSPLSLLKITQQANTGPFSKKSTVFKKPLALFSQSPMTGFYRDGYCRSGPEDGGNHAVAGLLTKEFLDFSAARGNNLRQVPGLKEGCKWCLCTARWKEAMEAAKGSEDPVVPK